MPPAGPMAAQSLLDGIMGSWKAQAVRVVAELRVPDLLAGGPMSAGDLAELTGREGFGHLEADPESAAIFNQAMVELTRLVAGSVVRAYDFWGTVAGRWEAGPACWWSSGFCPRVRARGAKTRKRCGVI